MKRLILATNDKEAESLRQAGLADFVIGFGPRFVWGPLVSQAELATLLEARSPKHDLVGAHWLDHLDRRLFLDHTLGDLGLVEFCERLVGWLPKILLSAFSTTMTEGRGWSEFRLRLPL